MFTILNILPDIALALLNDVIMTELVNAVSPLLSNCENHRTDRQWKNAVFYKNFAVYIAGCFTHIIFFMVVVVPFEDDFEFVSGLDTRAFHCHRPPPPRFAAVRHLGSDLARCQTLLGGPSPAAAV